MVWWISVPLWPRSDNIWARDKGIMESMPKHMMMNRIPEDHGAIGSAAALKLDKMAAIFQSKFSNAFN